MAYIYAVWLIAMLAFPQVVYERGRQAADPIVRDGEIVAADDALLARYDGAFPQILHKIAYCESGGSHFDKNGEVLIGVNRHDIGKYQINIAYWKDKADDLGYDLYTEEGNEAMALELYRRYGTEPWIWSKKCWNS